MSIHYNSNDSENNEKKCRKCRQTVTCMQHLHKRITSLHAFTVLDCSQDTPLSNTTGSSWKAILGSLMTVEEQANCFLQVIWKAVHHHSGDIQSYSQGILGYLGDLALTPHFVEQRRNKSIFPGLHFCHDTHGRNQPPCLPAFASSVNKQKLEVMNCVCAHLSLCDPFNSGSCSCSEESPS